MNKTGLCFSGIGPGISFAYVYGLLIDAPERIS